MAGQILNTCLHCSCCPPYDKPIPDTSGEHVYPSVTSDDDRNISTTISTCDRPCKVVGKTYK